METIGVYAGDYETADGYYSVYLEKLPDGEYVARAYTACNVGALFAKQGNAEYSEHEALVSLTDMLDDVDGAAGEDE